MDILGYHINFGFLFDVHSFVFICEILSVFAFIDIVSQKKRSPSSLLAWLTAIVLIPYLAVPLYFYIGIRKRKHTSVKPKIHMQSNPDELVAEFKHPISDVLIRSGMRKPTIDNTFKLYHDGIKAFEELMERIDKAEESIYMSTYVFQTDETTNLISEALIKKSKQGIQVKLLIDAIGSFGLYIHQSRLKNMREAGIIIKFFMPIFQNPFKNAVNLRNHRKIYLFDKNIVLTGGMNLGDEYLGPKRNENRWGDLLFSIRGHAVIHLYNLFIADWHYATKEKLKRIVKVPKNDGNQIIQIAPSGPDVETDALFNSILCGIYNAKERIWIVTPYFIPSEELLRALVVAFAKGVDVKLITPRESNHKLADLGRSSYMQRLYDVGIDVCLFDKAMIHAKAILFDKSVMLGSVNVDFRSLFLNYEVATFAYSEDIVEEVKSWMENLLTNASHEMPERGRIRKFGEDLVKIMAPLL
ncbi:phospholipase D-like domain-containing protein [Francisellaceae bacterium]|nr:phospholipase D-like domain-containing protein [Francisellaceae bacterium]